MKDGEGNGLCLNVARMGTGAGDDVWVTGCPIEHPDHANRGWSFIGAAAATGGHLIEGKLQNIRSW
jgi:hypothetical protein